MNSKKNPASGWKLYCIIDRKAAKQKDPVKAALFLFKSGADAVQLRHKNTPSYKLINIAKKIAHLAKKYKKAFLVNDRPDVALASGADGIHAGSGDMPIKAIRRLLKPRNIVGKTVHSPKEAGKARREKVNYVSAGPVFSTPLKSSLRPKGINFIKKIKKRVSIPVLAIGGINSRNAKIVFKGGSCGVCVARAAFEAKKIIKSIS